MSMVGNVIRVRPPRSGIPRDQEWHDTGKYARPSGGNVMKKIREQIQHSQYSFSTASAATTLIIGLAAGGIVGGIIGKKLSGSIYLMKKVEKFLPKFLKK